MKPYLSRCLLGSALLCSASAALAADPLDPSFAGTGLRVLNELGGVIDPIGACPHADGSVSVVGRRAADGALVQVRLTAAGEFDTGWKPRWRVELPLAVGLDSRSSATSCSGVGNTDPADDRMMIAARTPGDPDRVSALVLDLQRGGFDPVFMAGAAASYDIAYILSETVGGFPFHPRSDVRGVSPAPDGDWYLTGSVSGNVDGEEPGGFIARLRADGTLERLRSPRNSEFQAASISTARMGEDGYVRVLAAVRTATGSTWGLLRLEAEFLSTAGVSALGMREPDGGFALHRGRHLSGGVTVAAALRLGAAPRMLIVRGDAVTEVALPKPAEADATIGGSPAATGGGNGRAVFAAELAGAAAGFYAAVVHLGDGGSTPDVLDRRFGDNGRGQFHYAPSSSACPPGELPAQGFGNISSWGQSAVLVGYSAADCKAKLGDRSLVVAKIASSSLRVFRDGFD